MEDALKLLAFVGMIGVMYLIRYIMIVIMEWIWPDFKDSYRDDYKSSGAQGPIQKNMGAEF